MDKIVIKTPNKDLLKILRENNILQFHFKGEQANKHLEGKQTYQIENENIKEVCWGDYDTLANQGENENIKKHFDIKNYSWKQITMKVDKQTQEQLTALNIKFELID